MGAWSQRSPIRGHHGLQRSSADWQREAYGEPSATAPALDEWGQPITPQAKAGGLKRLILAFLALAYLYLIASAR